MENAFFPITWRGKTIAHTEEEGKLPIGQFSLLRIERKLEFVIKEFIRKIFNYDKIQVTLKKRDRYEDNANIISYSSGQLSEEDEHTKFYFAARLIDDRFYEFTISNIPVTTDSRHIKIFFNSLEKYLSNFANIIKKNMPSDGGRIIASADFMQVCEIWMYNIERTVILEYIYELFNHYNENYTNENSLTPKYLRYDIDYLNLIIDFAFELSTKKVENKEVYCGFIFHTSIEEVQANSILSIKFDKEFDFGDFSQLKNYIEISNGQNIFFNVTEGKISHLLITKEKLNEVTINPIGNGKTFQKRPLILSIQGNGKIYLLEGRSEQNKVILQIFDSRPIIRDNSFIENFIFSELGQWSFIEDEKLKVFSKWIMSLSQKKHGTSLIFKNLMLEDEEVLVKTVKITIAKNNFLASNDLRADLSLLDTIINPDGAVVFNSELIPTHISTILPIATSTLGAGGGARHNSILSFTEEFDCLGIVISEDGPITIFKKGLKIIKF